MYKCTIHISNQYVMFKLCFARGHPEQGPPKVSLVGFQHCEQLGQPHVFQPARAAEFFPVFPLLFFW